MSAFDSLPVAPEFCVSLKENATKTAIDCLKVLGVPEQVIALVEGDGLGYYLEVCYRNPEQLQRDRRFRYDIEHTVVETINAIAQTGGVFDGPGTSSRPRTVHLAIRPRKKAVRV